MEYDNSRNGNHAFLVYRDALRSVLRDYVEVNHEITDRDARQLYDDVLRPEIAKLHAQAQVHRKSAGKKFLIKAAASGAAIAIGVFGGLLPAELAALFKAVGGFSLVKEVGEALGSITNHPDEIRSHNFYFLLRIRERMRARS
jgi:hypothetical protein